MIINAPMQQRFMHVDHPDDERFDRVTIDIQPRWKESELSGDEWRFGYILQFWRKGEIIITKSYGSLEWALDFASTATISDNVGEAFDREAWDRTKDKCDQPGCDIVATVFFERLKPFTKQGQELVKDPGVTEFRQFCDIHTHRGDCSMDDADHNYSPIDNPNVSMSEAI